MIPSAASSTVSPSGSAILRADRRARGVDVERHLAAEESRRRLSAAEHDVGVGDGRLGPALAVADRARMAARAARADLAARRPRRSRRCCRRRRRPRRCRRPAASPDARWRCRRRSSPARCRARRRERGSTFAVVPPMSKAMTFAIAEARAPTSAAAMMPPTGPIPSSRPARASPSRATSRRRSTA